MKSSSLRSQVPPTVTIFVADGDGAIGGDDFEFADAIFVTQKILSRTSPAVPGEEDVVGFEEAGVVGDEIDALVAFELEAHAEGARARRRRSARVSSASLWKMMIFQHGVEHALAKGDAVEESVDIGEGADRPEAEADFEDAVARADARGRLHRVHSARRRPG